MKQYQIRLTSPQISTIMWIIGYLKFTDQLDEMHERRARTVLAEIAEATGEDMKLEDVVEMIAEAAAAAAKDAKAKP